MAPSPSANQPFEELAASWWDESGVLHGLGVLLDPVRIPFIVEVFRAELGGGPHRVLDLGAGGGVLSETLGDLGHSVVGLDPSLPSLKAGKDHGAGTGSGVTFVAGRGEQLPLAEDSFDAIVCMEVLEHVDDPAAVVTEASRVLRPGGVFIYSGPNRTVLNRVGLVLVAQDILGVVPRGTHRSNRLLRPEEVERHMRECGIEPVRTVGVGLRVRSLLRAGRGLAGLATRRLTHPEAARRIHLVSGTGTALAYQGFGRRR